MNELSIKKETGSITNILSAKELSNNALLIVIENLTTFKNEGILLRMPDVIQLRNFLNEFIGDEDGK